MKRLALVALIVICMISPSVNAQTATPATFSSYGADGSGTGVHTIGASNAFINFRTGAVDNSYPLAVTHLDASPAAQGTASIADSGPLGATAAGAANGASQPQYATATFPGNGKASQTQGGSVAEAAATETSADARGAVTAATSDGPGSVEKQGDGAQTSSDYGESHVFVDNAAGVVTAKGDGRVDRASFAAGLFIVSGSHVTASVEIKDLVATPSYTIDAGNATVGGTPVKVTDKGVEAAGPPQGGSDALQQVVNGQLNQALVNAGLQVFVTAPDVGAQSGAGHVAVSGIHVRYTQPTADASVPKQTVEYILGEARAFVFAVPANGGPSISAGAGTTAGPTTGGTGTSARPSGGVSSSTASNTGSQTAAAAPAAQETNPVSIVHRKPSYLVWLYLIWQTLVVCTGGALLWWRRMELARA
ncbi:MAG: hypothetical protein QOC92_3256 [Acidimicrobiaceae bacterium]